VIPTALGQTFKDIVNSNAISLDQKNGLNFRVYSEVEHAKLIMVGEMHGTSEPAELVQLLAESILKVEDSISIGIEILPELISLNDFSDSLTLLQTKYFQSSNTDGRRSQSWFNLILYVKNKPNISLFFIDAKGVTRDSLMYENIKKQRKLSPDRKIITLTGNYHSRFKSSGDMRPMGFYAKSDSFYKEKELISIAHFFGGGSMFNDNGNGIELTSILFEKSAFNDGVNKENYLLFLETVSLDFVNMFYYTKEVTAAMSVLNK
jgi:hypothetical protein